MTFNKILVVMIGSFYLLKERDGERDGVSDK